MKICGFLLFGCALVAGCSIPQTIEFPDEPNLPVEWGEYSTVTIQGTSCPDINGTYTEVPEVKRVKGYDITDVTGNRYSIYGLFPFEIAENSTVARVDAEKSQSVLRFSQNTHGDITMTHMWANGEKVETSVFKASEQDFDCVDSFIQFPINSIYGQLEGVKINGQNRTRVRLTQDQSLVVIRAYGKYRLSSETPKNDFVHEFYRFKSVTTIP
ncbi:MAG: hypothetical protein NUV80_02050 [Candidatus Berkelbacteria bacterium]|nr:hypothetical protein [Candidatus Berkelbacteria bacterium]